MKRFKKKPAILLMSSFPPTECGIATFSTDLLYYTSCQFSNTFNFIKCDLSNQCDKLNLTEYCLNPKIKENYSATASLINENKNIQLIHIQHEFGLFGGTYGNYLIYFLEEIKAPVLITFHTVLPDPNPELKTIVLKLASKCRYITVMTNKSANILIEDYKIDAKKIQIIPHGTHSINWIENLEIKKKYGLENRNILSTFGLLGPGKNIETALKALPKVIEAYPNTLYLIIGKTHPNNIINEIDEYRILLQDLTNELNINDHVLFLDHFIELPELLEILQGTDIYLFTSKDPNQAVSGTFSYAMGCGCPIIGTSIPHTREVLTSDIGKIIEIGNSSKLSEAVLEILGDPQMKFNMSLNAYKASRASNWENIAISQAEVYRELIQPAKNLSYNMPKLNLDHLKRMTTETGIIQFSKISQPDINSGYTLDDNARALIVMCKHYQLYGYKEDLKYIDRYLNFIEKCQTNDGTFINYLDHNQNVHIKNDYVNLEDSNSRAVWALGTVISLKEILPEDNFLTASIILEKSMHWIPGILSPRSIAFIIKGLYLCKGPIPDYTRRALITNLSKKLVSRYDLNKEKDWEWFEEYLTYANSVLPEAMLYAYLVTEDSIYKNIALDSFNFLLNKLFINNQFRPISNNGWYHKNEATKIFGEQPIDVGYTIEALENFYYTFRSPRYLKLMHQTFSWFLGNNHLKQLIYNPLTGGCHDGLEKTNVNLNQGAESTICFLMARLSMERVVNLKFESQDVYSTRSRILKNRHIKHREL
ncbi:glycosyltransferase involved in cell wall biosynthesis [Gillisia mitskevichiae]|uniref:Glycosyltransferase involved in cell wall biosynthesis n=1 Tax=Gillisia mitskevichiae TaxID=270921 RepID=A0A495PSY3_9FLAO|nr:glycosyltransferase [Gillisia mitskevichiae]RKS53651.1 glycosyltransferase involved in cell wall biosynthesis [Gillisia mitskevichiae]